jgi:uroporphyrinogen decarboxylase
MTKLSGINHRENLLRCYRFQGPQWIPISIRLPPILWVGGDYDPAEFEDLMLSHAILFPNYRRGEIEANKLKVPPHMVKAKPYMDGWGCVWETAFSGMVGAVAYHALDSWDKLGGFVPPDPAGHDGLMPIAWDDLRAQAAKVRSAGNPVSFSLPHGHTFLRLQDLRGYENLMFDLVDDPPQFRQLIGMVRDFNIALVKRFIELQPDMIGIPEDLGMQNGPMVSPAMFRKYIKPVYAAMTRPIKAAGILVHEHCDGNIMEIVDDLVEVGGDILNLQDLVNGLDNIARHLKGRVAVDLDIDRQNITVTGSPLEIEQHIQEAVMKLGSPQGGFSMIYQPWPPTSIRNIRAVMDTLEKYCTYWS